MTVADVLAPVARCWCDECQPQTPAADVQATTGQACSASMLVCADAEQAHDPGPVALVPPAAGPVTIPAGWST